MFDNYLPEGWHKYKIKDIGSVITGNTPPRKEPENYGGNLAWIKPPDLDKTMFTSDSEEKISDIGRRKVRLLPKGSVLVGCIGNIGKVAIADSELCTNQQINSIIPNKEIVDSIFLFYSMKRMRPKLEQIASSAVVPLLNKKDFSNIEIPLSPLPTQKKIATILEKAERLKEWRKEADRLTDEFLKSTFLEMFGNSIENYNGWKEETLGNLIINNTSISYGIVQPGNEFIDGVSIVRPVDITNNQLIHDNIKKIDPEIEKKYKRTRLEGNELLITVRGTTGNSVITNEKCNGFNVTRGIAVIRPEKKVINIFYLNEFLKSPLSQKYIKDHTRGATLQQINIKDLKIMPILLPPLPLQNKFTNIVQQVEHLREHQSQSKQHIDDLFNALMQKAFKGELAC